MIAFLKEIFTGKKLAVSIPVLASLIASLVFGTWTTKDYLEDNLFSPLKSINEKLPRSEYEADKYKQWYRDSVNFARQKYEDSVDNSYKDFYSTKPETSKTQGGK